MLTNMLAHFVLKSTSSFLETLLLLLLVMLLLLFLVYQLQTKETEADTLAQGGRCDTELTENLSQTHTAPPLPPPPPVMVMPPSALWSVV